MSSTSLRRPTGSGRSPGWSTMPASSADGAGRRARRGAHQPHACRQRHGLVPLRHGGDPAHVDQARRQGRRDRQRQLGGGASSAAPAPTSTMPRPRAPSTASRSGSRSKSAAKASASTRCGRASSTPISTLRAASPTGRSAWRRKCRWRAPGTAEEVANAIVWLLSDEASYTTGSILDVTGGRAIYGVTDRTHAAALQPAVYGLYLGAQSLIYRWQYGIMFAASGRDERRSPKAAARAGRAGAQEFQRDLAGVHRAALVAHLADRTIRWCCGARALVRGARSPICRSICRACSASAASCGASRRRARR